MICKLKKEARYVMLDRYLIMGNCFLKTYLPMKEGSGRESGGGREKRQVTVDIT